MYLSGVWSYADLWIAPSPTKDISLKEIGHFTQIWVHVLGSTVNIMGWTYMIIQESPPWHSIRKSYEVLQNWGNWLRPWFGIAIHVLHQLHVKYPRRSECKSNCFRPLILPKNHDMNLEPKPVCTTITRVGDFECIGPYMDTFLDWTPTLEWHMEHL
jgi:hypothetical protein